MRRSAPLVARCWLAVLAAITLAAPPSAAAARFRFGTHRAITPAIPAARHPASPDAALGVSEWARCGVVLTPATTNTLSFQIAFPDGAGGALVAWSDERNGGNADCFASRLDAGGNFVSGWTAGGNPVSLSDSSQIIVASGTDNAGGLFAVYIDVDPQFASFHDVYLQHLTSAGAVAGGYPANGKTMVTGEIGVAGMLPDGSGGLFLGWSQPSGTTIRAKRLDATGATSGGWPALGLDTGVPDQTSGEPALDGAGGLYIAWSTATQIVVQRFSATGVVSGWPAGGVIVYTAGSPFPSDVSIRIVRLSSGDALVVWDDPATERVYAQRVTAAGAVHGSWPAGGLQVSTGTDPEAGPEVIADGGGGALVMWQEHVLFPLFSFRAFVQRLTATGTISSGWPAIGVPLSSGTTTYSPSNLIGDGANGALAAWTELGGADADIYAQHVLATGTTDAAWTAGGVQICNAAGDQSFPRILTDNAGGAIVSFLDSSNQNDPQIAVSRILGDGTVSALASLVDASAEPGRVRLHWYTPDRSVPRATVERAEAGGEFVALGDVEADGEGHLRFEDRGVAAGATYRYRLAVLDGGAIVYLGQVTVRVPAAVSFGLAGFRPNPAGGEVNVVFALASAAPARLELLDVAGRRMLAREVGTLGPGEHVLRLEGAQALPAGIYVVRLSQAGRTVVTRSAIVR